MKNNANYKHRNNSDLIQEQLDKENDEQIDLLTEKIDGIQSLAN